MTHPTRSAGEDRRATIVSQLQSNGFLSVTALSQALGVSTMTIRRDLRALADADQLQVVHGGASLLHPTLRGVDFTIRGRQRHDAKLRVAQRALELVGRTATISIDAGTTTFELAALLESDFAGCLITNSVPVMQVALGLPGCRVVGAGGELLGSSQAFTGPRSVAALKGLHADIAFMGAAAVGVPGVFMTSDLEGPTKSATMATGRRVVLLADSTKFSASAPCLLCGLDRVDVLVTDAHPPRELAEALEAAEVEVLIAD